MEELILANNTHDNIPQKLVEFLLGKFDFYKIIGLDASEAAQIYTFNLRGTLNKSTRTNKPKKKIPIAELQLK